MGASNLHALMVYGFIGIGFSFPLIIFCLKGFGITNPGQRMTFYLFGLVLPIAASAAYYSLFVKRCQALGLSAGFFDLLCKASITAFRFVGPLILGMFGLGLIKVVAGFMFVNRMRKSGHPPDPDQLIRVQNMIYRRCREWRMAGPEIIFSQRNTFAAFVLGWPKPVLVINTALLKSLSDQELEIVLTHELVHIRRGDILLSWLVQMTRNLVFFAPFSTRLLRGYLLERECFCDIETAAVMGGRRRYAAVLLKVWRLLVDIQPQPGLSFIGAGQEMEYRITSLISGETLNKPQSRLKLIILLTFITTLTMLLLGIIC